MNKTIGLLLIIYSLLLAGLSYFVYRLVPAAVGQPTLIAGLAGGALCLVLGVRAVAGSGGKALPILTLIPVNFVMLSQTIVSWSGAAGESRIAAAATTLLLVLSVAMVVRIAWSGVVFDVSPTGAPKEGMKPQWKGKQATGGG